MSPSSNAAVAERRHGGTPTSQALKASLHSGSNESRHSLITNDFTSPSRMNGSSLEKASASSRVLKIAMFPPSANGPMPTTTPRATNLSTTTLWRGYTTMMASRLAPDDSPITTAFMRLLPCGLLAKLCLVGQGADGVESAPKWRCRQGSVANRVPMLLPDYPSRCTRTRVQRRRAVPARWNAGFDGVSAFNRTATCLEYCSYPSRRAILMDGVLLSSV